MDLLAHEPTLRLSVFLGLLALLMAVELAAGARAEVPRLVRWTNNLALVVLDAAILRLVFPVLAVGAALWAEARGIGLAHWLGLPGWVAFGLALILFDLALWAQHVVFHKVPWLWRLHRMHHADPVVDATTGLRFHPVEVVLSMAIKIALAVALGAPPESVLIFEVILNATSLFNHAALHFPDRVERIWRLVLITPALHRIHHSERRAETDSNFGFSVPWWDWLFGTYRAAPQGPITQGIGAFGGARDQWLDRLLVQPFRPGRSGGISRAPGLPGAGPQDG
jgi:sterol desaturase/sphingolipid hydroxylase (fatty acid hydroxylase superfamily)